MDVWEKVARRAYWRQVISILMVFGVVLVLVSFL